MPGILGTTRPSGADILSRMSAQLFRREHLHEHRMPGKQPVAGCYSIHREPRVLIDGTEAVVFDGYLLNGPRAGDEMLRWILSSFRAQGELFARGLRGSFQCALYCFTTAQPRVFIYADHTASRPLFIAENGGALYYAPELFPVMDMCDQRRVDYGALVHFMMAGHFPAEKTLAAGVRLLGPGQYIRCLEDGRVEWKTYFEHILSPAPRFDCESTVQSLISTLDRTIMNCWRHARNPAILLSGGVDSRYIFYTIARHVEDTSKLVTVTWGDNPSLKNSDVEIAGRIARKFATRHLFFPRDTRMFAQDFNDMLLAQSGMTDSCAVHCHELETCRVLREVHGIESLMRGDECFGFGPQIHTLQDAFLVLNQSLAVYIPTKDRWFDPAYRHLWESFDRIMQKKIPGGQLSHSLFKDMLYFNERIPMALQPLNYYKYFYQDVYLPYLDADVLEVIRGVPDAYRADKRIFHLCMKRRYSAELDIPLSTRGNWTDWERTICGAADISAFFKSEIAALPQVFNKDFFEGILDSICRGKKNIRFVRQCRNFCVRLLPRRLLRLITATGVFNDRMDRTAGVLHLFRAVTLSRTLKRIVV